MKELVKLGGDQDEVAAAVVIERSDAEYIARAEERAVAAIPHSESEIAQDVDRSVFSPLQIGFQNQFGVRAIAQCRPFGLERFTEIFAVVDAAIKDEAHLAALVA